MLDEECEDADKNPLCPHLTRIETMEAKIDGLVEKLAGMKVDLSWLRRGYFLQVFFGINSFLAILALILKFVGVL